MRSALADGGPSRGRPWWVAALVLVVVGALVGAVVAWRASEQEVPTTPVPGVQGARASAGGAALALRRFVAAVAEQDPTAVADLAPADDPRARALLEAVGDNTVALRLDGVGARYVDGVGPVRADGSWDAAVDLSWSHDGFDRVAARSEVLVTFVREGDRVAIEGFGSPDDDRRTPLWLQAPLSVVRDSSVLVAVDGSRAEAREIAARAHRGITVVGRTLPAWRPAVVVLVPSSAAALDETLGAAPGTYGGIAAVTATADGSASRSAPTQVYVNPEITDRLHRRGAQVVMTHEIAHVATDAATSVMDTWLLEGFADFVALRGTRLPDSVTLGRAIADVRRNGVPRSLPDAEDFDTRADGLESAYELAWLACRILAGEIGVRRFVGLYEQVEGGRSITSALRRAGMPRAVLVEKWQDHLRDLAG